MIPQPRSRPDRVQVGDRRNGGQLSASRRMGERGERVFVNAAELGGIVVDVSPQEFRRFCLEGLALVDDVP